MRHLLVVATITMLYACGTMMGAKAAPEEREYQKIIDVEGVAKDDLYIKVNSWFVETFNSAESVIEFQDKEAGKVMGKYTFSYAEGVYTYRVRQTVEIDIKDGKARMKVSNPYYLVTSGMGETYYDSNYRKLETKTGIARARSRWAALAQDLEVYINTEDDW